MASGKIFTPNEIKLIGKLYRDPNNSFKSIAAKLGRKTISGVRSIISKHFTSKKITKQRKSINGSNRKGIDVGKKGRSVFSEILKKKHIEVFKLKKKKCSRCKKVKNLKNFRPLSKNEQRIEEIIIYTSHCNLCDAKRTAIFKSKKASTIDGTAEYLMSNVKRRVRDKNLKCEIDISWIIKQWNISNKCYYTGLKMKLLTNRKHFKKGGGYKKNRKHNVSIDRKNSSIGYTKQNSVLCSWVANNMKQDLSEKDFYKYCNIIQKNKIRNYKPVVKL